MGLFDGLFFIILTLILLKILNLYGVKFTQNYLNNLASYLIIYGISTGNFGTGIRHRTKFIIIFIILVSPWIPNISFNKN